MLLLHDSTQSELLIVVWLQEQVNVRGKRTMETTTVGKERHHVKHPSKLHSQTVWTL